MDSEKSLTYEIMTPQSVACPIRSWFGQTFWTPAAGDALRQLGLPVRRRSLDDIYQRFVRLRTRSSMWKIITARIDSRQRIAVFIGDSLIERSCYGAGAQETPKPVPAASSEWQFGARSIIPTRKITCGSVRLVSREACNLPADALAALDYNPASPSPVARDASLRG